MPKSDDEHQELSTVDLIARAVDTALQAHKVWSPELSETIEQIVQIADKVSEGGANVTDNYLLYGTVDYKKLGAVEPEQLFRAIAILEQAAADHLGKSLKHVEDKIKSYARKK